MCSRRGPNKPAVVFLEGEGAKFNGGRLPRVSRSSVVEKLEGHWLDPCQKHSAFFPCYPLVISQKFIIPIRFKFFLDADREDKKYRVNLITIVAYMKGSYLRTLIWFDKGLIMTTLDFVEQ